MLRFHLIIFNIFYHIVAFIARKKPPFGRQMRIIYNYVISDSFFIPKISLRIPLQNFGLSIIITFISTLRYLLMMKPRIMTAQDRTATIKDLGHIIATIIPSPKAEK